MSKKTFPITEEANRDLLHYIQDELTDAGMKEAAVREAVRVAELSSKRLTAAAAPNAEIEVSIRHWYNTATITLSAPGQAIEASDEPKKMLARSGAGNHTKETMKAFLTEAYAKKVSYFRKGESNFFKISAGAREQLFVIRSLVAFVSALLVALLVLLFVPEDATNFISAQILLPIQTVFLNALKLVTAPAVFFTIMVCVARYSSLSDPGHRNSKIMLKYVISAVIAVLIGLVLVFLFRPLEDSMGVINQFVNKDIANAAQEKSITDMVVSMVPDNFIAPFLNTDSMQLLVIAALGGLAIGHAGRHSKTMTDFANTLHKFFTGVVNIVNELIPVGTFFVTLLMIFSFGFHALIPAAIVLGLTVLGFLLLWVAHLIYIRVAGGLNPFVFFRKYKPYIRKTLVAGSGTNAIPETMRCCKDKLGIPSEIYAFSVPYGAISNLDGNCVYLTVAGMVLAQLCGINLFGKSLIPVVILIVFLSVGSPITPASAILALTLLMGQMGVNIGVVCIMLGFNAVIEVLLAACNALGDAATALVFAKREGLLDLNVYYSKEQEDVI